MRIVPVLVAIVAVVSPASAQPVDTIAVEGGVSHQIGQRLEGCDECTPLARHFGGEVAFFWTDSLAVLARGGVRFLSVDVSADDFRLELDTRELYGSIGLRYHGPPGRARFFGEVAVGYSAFGEDLVTEGSSTFVYRRRIVAGLGLIIAPGAGVDIALNDRTAVRLSGRWDIGKFLGEAPQQNVGVGAGLVFNVGGAVGGECS